MKKYKTDDYTMGIIDKAHEWLQENATMYRGDNASDCMIAAFVAGASAGKGFCPDCGWLDRHQRPKARGGVMTKIVKIESCWGCPLKKEKDVYQENYWCTIALRMFDIRECPELCVPDWCPLEDAPDTGELASNCVECSGPNGFHYALCSKSDTGEEG